jgi:beta-lactamase regulating signal transducer with metallopeptidase domain
VIPVNLSPLANHLWQSTLFTAAAWLLTLALRKNRAAIRYTVWLTASIKFLVPFSLLVSIGSQFGWRATPAIGPVPIAHVMEQISQPFAQPLEAVPTVTDTASSNPVPVLLFSVWFCGFAVSAAVWLRFWRRFRAALRAATPLRLELPIPVMTSPARLEPGVFGMFKPILLLPEGILNRLAPAQLQSILAHELCHVCRRDNLTAATHMLVESIFWFHPLVWWIGAQLVEERERACDEEVVRLGYKPDVYAEGILNVCKFYLQSPLTCASGVTGADLRKRIEAIVNYRIPHRLTSARKLLLTAAGVAAVAGPALVGILNVPQSGAQSTVEQLPFELPSVGPADGKADGKAPAGMPSARLGEGGPLLLAQIVPAQATKPREPAPPSTQRIRFEAVPEPPESPPTKISGPTIEAIEFRGASRVGQFALRAMIDSRVGGVYDIETLRRDSQALYNTQRFSSVAWETDSGPAGVIVRFVVVERPLIESIEYQGDHTVTIAEILQRFKQLKIKLRVETLFNQDELGRAAVTVQELVAERGRQDITVTPFVEPIPPSSVKITFRVEEKQ